jgi:hypothetical protein
MKITRKKFIGSVAAISGASITGLSFMNENQPAPGGTAYTQAKSPVTWLPKRTIGREGDTTDDLTSFINKKYCIQNTKFKGQEGWTIQIKPTGYRGVPIWTISKIVVKIDGQEINQDDVIFILEGRSSKVSELKDQIDAQWYVLDWATLFIPKPGGMPMGTYEVDVRMNAVSIYNTSGTYREATSGTSLKLPVIVPEL